MPRDRDAVYRELLAVRCQRGDRAAWDELVLSLEGRLLYFVRRLVRDEADAFDVIQKTWMRAITGIGSLDEPRKLVPWLYRIARNVAYTHARLRTATHESLGDETAEIPDASDEQTEFENAERVHAGLETLTLAHREILALAFLEDMSLEDVAVVLGIPVGTVKSRLHYAKRALKSAIERGESP